MRLTLILFASMQQVSIALTTVMLRCSWRRYVGTSVTFGICFKLGLEEVTESVLVVARLLSPRLEDPGVSMVVVPRSA